MLMPAEKPKPNAKNRSRKASMPLSHRKSMRLEKT